MVTQTIEYATKETIIRQRIAMHQSWIESELGILLSETVIVEVGFPFSQLAIKEVLKYSNQHHDESERISRLQKSVKTVVIPPQWAPAVKAELASQGEFDSGSTLSSNEFYSLDWMDCPVSVELHGLDTKLIALNVEYRPEPTVFDSNVAHLAILKRPNLQTFLDALYASKGSRMKSKLYTPRSHPRLIATCEWDQLVLDPDVISLLKNDFDSFFERYDWFKKMRLPFRRGYLLHGPPGNGKSTAIRAMLTSRGLSAHTIHLFDSQTDDGDLDALFARAEENRPAVVLLEDLDRAFPRTGETKSKVSMQQLLNCLDGVGTSEGIIVIATANEPTILDPAILRRPGRFDRVVYFGNPSGELRRDYFMRMHPELRRCDLDDVVFHSEGFSFAFLREAYILSGQRAFEEGRDIRAEDLETAVSLLKDTIRQTSRQAVQPGFMSSPVVGVGK